MMEKNNHDILDFFESRGRVQFQFCKNVCVCMCLLAHVCVEEIITWI